MIDHNVQKQSATGGSIWIPKNQGKTARSKATISRKWLPVLFFTILGSTALYILDKYLSGAESSTIENNIITYRDITPNGWVLLLLIAATYIFLFTAFIFYMFAITSPEENGFVILILFVIIFTPLGIILGGSFGFGPDATFDYIPEGQEHNYSLRYEYAAGDHLVTLTSPETGEPVTLERNVETEQISDMIKETRIEFTLPATQ